MFYLKILSHFIFNEIVSYIRKRRGKGTWLKLRRISTWVQTRIMLIYEGKRLLLQAKPELFKFNQSRISLTSDQDRFKITPSDWLLLQGFTFLTS